MQKTIWIFNHYAKPNIYPGGTRHFDISKQLIKRGYNVTIFASSFLHGKDKNILNKNEKYKLEEYDGVKFLWLNTKPAYEGNGIKRFLNMISYFLLVMKYHKILKEKPDIIIGSSVHLFACLAGVFLSKKYKALSITEIRDIWPQSLVEIGSFSKHHPVVIFFNLLEKYVYSKTSYIITLLENSKEYFIKKGFKNDQIIHIPNGVDIEQFIFNKNNYHTSILFVTNKINICYCGAHGKANGLDNIINAIKIVNEKGYENRFVMNFIGNGPEKANLIKITNELKIQNIKFFDQIEKKYIASTLSNSDILLFNLMKLSVLDHGISPNKLFDYMCSGKFIISACNEEVDLVKKANCGINVEPDVPEQLANAIIKAINMTKEERDKLGQNGFEYVKKYHNISDLADKLVDIIVNK